MDRTQVHASFCPQVWKSGAWYMMHSGLFDVEFILSLRSFWGRGWAGKRETEAVHIRAREKV